MDKFLDTFGPLSPMMRGFTVSLILLTGALPAFFAGQLADRYGRTLIIGAGALIFALGALLQALAVNLAMFLVGRGLAGLGQGLFLSNIYVSVTSSSTSPPPHLTPPKIQRRDCPQHPTWPRRHHQPTPVHARHLLRLLYLLRLGPPRLVHQLACPVHCPGRPCRHPHPRMFPPPPVSTLARPQRPARRGHARHRPS